MGCGASAPSAHVPHVAGRTIAEEYRTNNKGAASSGARFELTPQSQLQLGDLVLVPGQVQANTPATVAGSGEAASNGGERMIPVVETVPMQFDMRHLTRIGRSTGDKKVQQQLGKLEVDYNMQNRPLTGDILCILAVGDVVDTPRGLSMVVGPTGSDGMLKVSGLEEVTLANGSKSLQVKPRSVAPSSVRKVGSVQIAPGGVFPAPPRCDSVDNPNRQLQPGACEVRPGDICDSVHGHVLVTAVPKSPDWKVGGTLRIQRTYPVSRLTLVGGPTFEARGNPGGATHALAFASNVVYEQRRQQAAVQEAIKFRSVADNGVSLTFLVEFIKTCDGAWSTEEVVKQHPIFTNVAVRTSSRYTDIMPQQYVGKPTYFVSHCWRDNAKLLVEQLKAFVDDKYRREKDSAGGEWARKSKKEVYDSTFFWIDIFAVNQGAGNATDMADVNANLARSVQQAKNGTLVMFGSDGTPLTRVWCLYELLVTWSDESRKNVQMLFAPPTSPLDIESSAWNDLSVTAAHATKATDKQMILQRIQQIETRTGRSFEPDLRANLLLQIEDQFRSAKVEFGYKTKETWFLYQKAGQKLILFYQLMGKLPEAISIAKECTESPEPADSMDPYKTNSGDGEDKLPTMEDCEPLLLAKQYALLGQVLRKYGDQLRAQARGSGEVNLNLVDAQREKLAEAEQTYRSAIAALGQSMEAATKVNELVRRSWPHRSLNMSVLNNLGMLLHVTRSHEERDQTFAQSSDELKLMLHDARINWTDQPWDGNLNLTMVEMRDTTNESGKVPAKGNYDDVNKALASQIALQAHKLLQFVESDFNLKRKIDMKRWDPLLKDSMNPGSANNWCNNLNSLHWINVGLLCLQSNQVDRAGSSMLDAVIASKKYRDPAPYLAMSCLYMGVATSWLDLEAPDTDGFAGIKGKPPAQVPATFSIDKQPYPIDPHLKESWVNWVQVIPQNHPSWFLVNAILSNWNQELLWRKFAAASWVVTPESTILKPHTRSTHPQGQAGIDAENSVPLFPLLGVEYQSLAPGTAYNYGSAIMQQIAETGKDCISTRWMADLKTVKTTWHNRMKAQRQTLQNEVNAQIQKRLREYQDNCSRFGVQPDFACLHLNDLANLNLQAGAFAEATRNLQQAVSLAQELPPSHKDNNGRVLLLNDKVPSEALLGLSLFNLAFVKFFHIRMSKILNEALEPNQSLVNAQAAANPSIEDQLNRSLEKSIAAKVVTESGIRSGQFNLEASDAEATEVFAKAEKLWQSVLGDEHPAWMLINSLLTMRLVGVLRIVRDQATSKIYPLHHFRVNAGDFNGPRRVDFNDPRWRNEQRRNVTWVNAVFQRYVEYQAPVRQAMQGM